MYLTFDEYLDNGGSVTDETAFSRLEAAARHKLDYRTRHRIPSPAPDFIVPLMVELIELEHRRCDSAGGLRTLSNDGVSVSFAELSEAQYAAAFEDAVCAYAAAYAKRGAGHV